MALIDTHRQPIILSQQAAQSTSRGTFVYLAYIDDSNQKRNGIDLQVLAGVILNDLNFRDIELITAVHAMNLIPEDRIDQFEEFHATELYNGWGAFEGIAQEQRFRTIYEVLLELKSHKIPIVYGAVDAHKLQTELYGSADPTDIAFRICTVGVDKWLEKNDPEQIAVLIADDSDKHVKGHLTQSFRCLRSRFRAPDFTYGQLRHIHDGMYFGSSKDSIGIQMADMCAYFIARHLRQDMETERYYRIIEDQIFYSERIPRA